ncbi:alkaline phosphatase-like protein [Xylariaceae sp. FL0255]|nr:alkaline phosphatase-like protein [Xylariaceae sp. FL0255]
MHRQKTANKSSATAMVVALLLLILTKTAAASFDGNLNYASPSKRHRSMGIDVAHVARRTMKRGALAYAPEELNFTHGVASGDPLPDRVISSNPSNVTVEGTVPLYSHDTQIYIKADPNPICVDWAVVPLGSSKVVSSGTAYTTSDIDYTIKVEAVGLQPLTSYNYHFTICGSTVKSVVGRTKTAPTADAEVKELTFAVFSCSNYRKLSHEQDYFVHLGDFIYEDGNQGERAHMAPKLLFSLLDYRTRYGQYRTDPDLQLASQNFAWITTWDDHEVSNNGYRDGSSGLNNTEDSFLGDGGVSVDQRKMNAVRAYFEWMPIRQVDLDDNLRVWRTLQLGNLMLSDLIILDTRNYDRNITDLSTSILAIKVLNTDYIDTIRDDASRSMMGSRQEHWFYNQLSASSNHGAAWRGWESSTLLETLRGYIANRNRTLKHLYDNNISNNVFLAGDSHQNWVSDLVWLDEKDYNPETGDGSIGVEFGGPAVSSTGEDAPIIPAHIEAQYRVGNNTELQWQDDYHRGYIFLSVKPDVVEARDDNKLRRPVAGGEAEAGALRGDVITPTNLSLNTDTFEWEVIGFDQMYITIPNS